MDEIVKAALNKWPNVPHCFGWLALDARGVWRMRDERAQALNLAGDKIRNATLLGFINRNYQHDELGRWYFQNGPQRVYVDLEATPYIAHTSPQDGFVLHTGIAMTDIDSVFLSAEGKMFLCAGEILAQLDDRDIAGCLSGIKLNGQTVSDEQLMTWLENAELPSAEQQTLSIELAPAQKHIINIKHGKLSSLIKHFGYIATPR